MNIVFFDAGCGFCRKRIHYLIQIDKKKVLHFAPLGGVTAKKYSIKEKENIVFLEGSRIWIRSKAIARIFYKLDRPVLSKIFLLPGMDTIYVWIARHRAKLSCHLREKKFPPDRFLP